MRSAFQHHSQSPFNTFSSMLMPPPQPLPRFPLSIEINTAVLQRR